jgi:hypothetical protein
MEATGEFPTATQPRLEQELGASRTRIWLQRVHHAKSVSEFATLITGIYGQPADDQHRDRDPASAAAPSRPRAIAPVAKA